MATCEVTYNFTNSTASDAEQVDQNFADVVGFVNNECIQRDGSTPMTGDLTLAGPGSEDDHAVTVEQLGDGPPSLSMGGVALDDDRINSVGSYEQWGTAAQLITFADPGRAVSVQAVLSGQVVSLSSTLAEAVAHLSVSFDGGTTYTDSEPCHVSVDIDTHKYVAIGCNQYRTGTPTSTIKVKAEITQVAGAVELLEFQNGHITALMIPA